MNVQNAVDTLNSLQNMDADFLDKRWESDGAGSPWLNINKKYGYMVFALSCANVITIGILGLLKVRLPAKGKKSDGFFTKLLRKLVYCPLWLQVAVWLVFIVLLLFIPWYLGIRETPDYIHFKIGLGMLKRAGRLGLSLYPLIIFLSLKPNPLPDVLYMHLIPLHKWISRVLIASIMLHSFGWFGFWIHKNELHKSFDKLMFPGVVNFFLLLIVLILGIKSIRERFYKLFYFLHILTAWITLSLMYLHSMPEANLYIFGSLYLLIYHTAAKVYLSYNIRDKVDETNSYYTFTVPDSNLLLVRIPQEKIIKASTRAKKEQDGSLLTYFLPGSHIRISPSLLNPKSWLFATHPYTIASLDNEEYVDLVMKKSNRFAKLLMSRLYFSYTVSLPFPAFDDFFFSRNLNDNITIVSGGSGLAFGLPIFKYFHQLNKKAADNFAKNPNLRFCVIVRRKEDLFILKEAGILLHQEDPDSEILELTPNYKDAKIEIHITGSIEPPKPGMFSRIGDALSAFRKQTSNSQYYPMEDLQPMLSETELDEPNAEVNQETNKTSVANHAFALEPHLGRPDVASVLDELHNGTEEETSIVVACGPEALLAECGRWCHHNNVEFASESFSI